VTCRILHIIPSLDRSGAEKQLVLLAGGLARDEFDVHVCALTRGGPREAELADRNVPATVIGKRWKVDPAAYVRLKRLIRRLRPTIVHTWMFAANAYGRAAALSESVPHLVASERCVDPWKRWHQLTIDRRLARRTDALLANSTGVRDFYVAKGLPREKFHVIPNAVERPPASDVTREELLAELKLPPDARLIGGIGRLWPQKRWKDVIWATDLLKVIRDDAHFLIIGEGPQRARLERYRDLVRLADKVHFLGQRGDVPRIMPHFDLVWLASGYEGMPNAVMEAMAAGVPVVASDIPGTRDLVVHRQTGYLVPVGDRAAFSRFAQKILEDPQHGRQLGSAGRQRVETEFTVNKMVERHAALYREILGR